ncbi:MAG: ABC transporter ATP-binding protein [Deltaproteobacteria bacterium]|nr:ABC transporter ATP-binding protein [Deltaproteobacteria bacterium]
MSNAPDVIQVRNLTRRFGSFVAVDDVSFDVQRGEIFGYLGANGAGKSTTIRMLCGLLEPSSGSAIVAGVDVKRDPEKVKRAIGYMSQKFSLYSDLTVEENIEFFGGAYGIGGRRLRERTRQVLAAVDLEKEGRARTGDLPGGWRQRLALGCAILHEPTIVFLDEPTAGVDPLSRRTFWQLIRTMARAGTTVLVTTHYMDEAEYCDRVGLMVDGKLAALDTPHGLKDTFVPGSLVEVRGPGPEVASWLAALPGAAHVERFGAGFHVRGTGNELEPARLRDSLAEAGFPGAIVESLEPTLEDVFLEVVRAASVKNLARVEA